MSTEAAPAQGTEQAALAPPRRHEPALDGLRGVAVLLVIIDHLLASLHLEFGLSGPVIGLAHFGWSGVDLFFVLSGFLITGILYNSKGQDHYFRNFYARRALRIFPLYYATLIGFLLCWPLFQHFHFEPKQSPGWLFVYLTNVVLGLKGNGSFGALDHFWSLAVEEHFYFIWPAIVFFFERRTVMIIAGAMMAVALALRIACLQGGDHVSLLAYVLTPMRMDSLAAGAFIALAARGPKGMDALVKPAVVLGGAAFLVFAAIAIVRRTNDALDAAMGTLGFSMLWTMFGALLILCLKWRPLVGVMSNAVLRWFGKYSYGMYVWHPIIFLLLLHTNFVRALRGELPTMLSLVVNAAAAIVVTLLVTLASWHLWEKHFLKLKTRFPD